MISATAVVIMAAATLSAGGRDANLVRRGGDPAKGLLVNHSKDARPFDAPDPSKPTVVFIHGLNPLPHLVHFTMAQEVADAITHREGSSFNVMGWDWNASTLVSLQPRANSDEAVRQGQLLADSLLKAGLDPSRVHLIGHSSGAMVATSAAWVTARRFGKPIAQLTLLDPATYYHWVIFQRLQAGSLAPIVENYWSPGPSAYGSEVALAGVWNYRVEGYASYAGVICPLRSDHLFIVRWYLDTIECPGRQAGFNQSLLLVGNPP